MSTIVPNNLDVAKKGMAIYIEKSGVELPESIKESESHLYHVAVVKRKESDPVTLEWKIDVAIQMFDRNSWNFHKGNLSKIGYGESYIFHDPTKKVEVDPVESEGEELTRSELKSKAVSLGYDGALNVSNDVFEQFIEENS